MIRQTSYAALGMRTRKQKVYFPVVKLALCSVCKEDKKLASYCKLEFDF